MKSTNRESVAPAGHAVVPHRPRNAPIKKTGKRSPLPYLLLSLQSPKRLDGFVPSSTTTTSNRHRRRVPHSFLSNPRPPFATFEGTYGRLRSLPENDEDVLDDGEKASDEERRELVTIVQGPFTPTLFSQSGCWGSRPLLVKNAFDPELETGEENWPAWEDVWDLSGDEDAESRLVSHIPGEESSYELQLGPFSSESFPVESANRTQTLVVNDVDRFYPPLSDWTDSTFSFVPRWRRDDAQISMTPTPGGGIGPHLDNYDVFLIQTSGTKEWRISPPIPPSVERRLTIEDLNVRILRGYSSPTRAVPGTRTFVVEPGDMLYLPPRVVHHGISTSEGDCMTLSVGCRSPSVSEVVVKLVEGAMEKMRSGDEIDSFYSDGVLLGTDGHDSNPGEISQKVKNEMKSLVVEGVKTWMEDEDSWDDFLGRMLSEPKRVRVNYPVSLVNNENHDDDTADDDDWIIELGIWGDPKQAVDSVYNNGHGALYHAEGVIFAYSSVMPNNGSERKSRLFANGLSFEIAGHVPVEIIANERRLTKESFCGMTALDTSNKETIALLEDLVAKGLLYGADE